MDGCSRQTGQQHDDFPIDGDHSITIQDRIPSTTQIFGSVSLFRPLNDHNPISADDERMPSAFIVTTEGANGVAVVSLQFIWQLVVVAGNFPEYASEASDMYNHRARALNLYQKHLGNTPYDPSCMDTILPRILEDDQLQEAEELALLAVDLSESWLGPDHIESWKAKGNLAHVYYEQGRYHTAHQLGIGILDFFQHKGDEFDENAHIFKTNLSNTLLMLGRKAEAKDLCYDVVRSASLTYGKKHNITLTAKFHLARVYNSLCDYHKAREILNEVMFTRKAQQKQGLLTAKTLRVYIELGETLRQLGLVTESIAILGQVEKKLQGSRLIRSMWTLELLWSTGKLLYSLRHYEGAEKVFRNLAEYIPTRTKSTHHPHTVYANCWLANSLGAQHKSEQEIKIHKLCFDILSDNFGLFHRDTLICMSNLARSRKNSLTVKDFGAKMVEVLEAQKLHLGQNDPDTLGSEQIYARIMWERGDWNGAQALLKEVRSKLEFLPDTRRSYIEWKLMRYEAKFYFGKGQYGNAAKIQKNRVLLGELIFGKEHPQATDSQESLAITLSRMGHYDDAEHLLCNAISRLSGSLGRKHPAVTKLKSSQAIMLGEQKKMGLC